MMYERFNKKAKGINKLWYLLIVVLILIGHCFAVSVDNTTTKFEDEITHYNHIDNHRNFSLYFMKIGSKTPQQMAEAVLHTRSPRLLAAMAKVESNGNPHIRNTGYKKRHSGAWQVNPKYWGKVSHDPIEQAKQTERILEDLVKNSNIRSALANYGVVS